MQEVLALLEKRKQEFAQLPLFEYMQDKSIHPRQRLAWAPCFAPIAMGFNDLLKYHFRKEPPDNKIQELINKHTYEEENHYLWFLEDLEKLELNPSIKFSDCLQFLWSHELSKTRLACYQIALNTFQESPVVVLAAIEAIEATADIIFTHTTQVTQELQEITNQKYCFFGQYHFDAEANHAIKGDNMEYLIESMQLTEEEKFKAFEVVDKIFGIVTGFIHEFMSYLENHPIETTFTSA
ncbi:MAG: hypothetical protein QNJ47_14990 [Nostocaceae cyanobacterium]|nr:hypothetical protein [Nostocaceae cyanobacterium]